MKDNIFNDPYFDAKDPQLKIGGWSKSMLIKFLQDNWDEYAQIDKNAGTSLQFDNDGDYCVFEAPFDLTVIGTTEPKDEAGEKANITLKFYLNGKLLESSPKYKSEVKMKKGMVLKVETKWNGVFDKVTLGLVIR
jgi:hypothetical protein